MSDHLLKIIGNRIESLRIEKNISREKLEEACNLPEQSIKKIERNPSKTFDVCALNSIADYFDVDMDYLLGKQDEKRKSVTDASIVTGLTCDAVKVLSDFGRINQTEIDTLSAFMCSPSFLSFVDLMTRYCLLEDNSRSLSIDGHSYLSSKEVMIAAIQNSVSLLMNETKKAAQEELIKTDIRTRAFALVSSSIINVNKKASESEIREALAACGLDADKEIQAFHEYYAEYKQSMKGRI